MIRILISVYGTFFTIQEFYVDSTEKAQREATVVPDSCDFTNSNIFLAAPTPIFFEQAWEIKHICINDTRGVYL